jgi:hypothetical protein
MRWLLPPEQRGRLGVALAIAGLAFVAQGPLSTSAAYTDTASLKTSAFSTGSWCATNAYPGAVLGTVPAPSHYLRLDETGLVVSAADSAPGSPPAAVVSGTGLQWGAAGLLDCTSATALGVNGSGTPQVRVGGPAMNGPDALTLSMWVDLSGGEGRLLGFSNTATGTSTRYDRHLYLDNTGHVRFGIWTGTGTTIRSDAVVTGGRHHIAATLGAAGMRLYVDGVLQTDQQPGVTQGEQGYTGYWRLGWNTLAGWPGLTSATAVPVGTLDEVAIWDSQLTPTDIAALAAANHG